MICRRVLSSFLIGLFLAGVFGPLVFAKPASACACCGTYKVVNVASWDKLNVRTGPGVNFQIIHRLSPGEGCIVQTGEIHGNWVRVEHAGLSGWVHQAYLALIN